MRDIHKGILMGTDMERREIMEFRQAGEMGFDDLKEVQDDS